MVIPLDTKNSSPYLTCFLCPRRCGINRNNTNKQKEYGYCRESSVLHLACVSIHKGEEPPISGTGENRKGCGFTGGSGTIFISGCNLGCVFCQNWQISLDLPSMSNLKTEFATQTPGIQPPVIHDRFRLGKPVETAEFARVCLALQEKGAENINIVTGSHAVPAIVEGITAAKEQGLVIPVLWNSSAYELSETLDLLETVVDVFLPDMKTLDSAIAGQYFNAPDYPVVAAAAIEKMLEMRKIRFDASYLVSGVMVRHLVLPGYLEASREVLRWFADHCNGRALLSLMFQYTPITNMAKNVPDRYITQEEYDTVLGWLGEFNIEDGYCQELVPGNTDWLPDFGKYNPFPSELSIPVWHWKNGFIR
ncbi:MAG: radical SAM protein [Treponema sp.]|nr:radical SAM protein [Treponema sp.]